jgi:hypothetical protein
VYGEPRWLTVTDPELAFALRTFPRQALHAWRLELTHPATRARLSVEAPMPRDLEELLAKAGLDQCLYTPPRRLAGGTMPFRRKYTAICP